MNNFIDKFKPNMNKLTFDEHIEYLQEQINKNNECIRECTEEIEQYENEIKRVQKEKENFLKNGDYKPSIYLNCVVEEKKKSQIYEWCKQHELKYHKELVGNYWKENHMSSEKHAPNYEFISSTSNTSKIRYVRCLDCYKNAIKNEEDTEWTYCYLKD